MRGADGGSREDIINRSGIKGAIRQGEVKGGIKGKDSVDAKLMPGEYVIPTDVVEKIGKENLDAMVESCHEYEDESARPSLRNYADGGFVDDENRVKPRVVRGVPSPQAAEFVRGQYGTAPPPGAPPVAAAPVASAAPVDSPRMASLRTAAPSVAKAVDIAKVATMPVLKGGARMVGNLAVPAIETARTADVATNPAATQEDVLTQGASGVGRWGSTAAGAGIGAAVGGPVGALIGGGAGYFLGDKAIQIGRKLAGTDTRDPIDRLPGHADSFSESKRPDTRPSLPAQAAPDPSLRTAAMAARTEEGALLDEVGNTYDKAGNLLKSKDDPSYFDTSLKTTRSGNNVSITGDGGPVPRMMQTAEGRQSQLRAAYAPTQYGPDPKDKPLWEKDPWGRDRPFGATEPGTWSEMMNQKAEMKINREREANAQRDRDSQRSTQATLRGQNMTAATARAGQEQTAATARANARLEEQKAAQAQKNTDRAYEMERKKYEGADGTGGEKARVEQQRRESAVKATQSRVESFLPPAQGPDGKPMPDTAKSAKYMTGLNTVLSTAMQKAEQHLAANPNDTKARAWLERAKTESVGALDDDDIRKFIAGMQAKEIAEQSHSTFNPMGGTAVVSDKPVESLTLKKGVFSDDYVTDRGDVIPASKIDKKGGFFGFGAQQVKDYDSLKKQPSLRNRQWEN